MSDTLEKETQSRTPATPVRIAGAESSGRARGPRTPKAPILNKEIIKKIGYTLAGKHWQADVAQMLGFSKSQMTRWLNESRPMPPTLNVMFEQVLYDRLIALADCLVMPGMPQSKEAREIRDQIYEMVDPLRIKQPTD